MGGVRHVRVTTTDGKNVTVTVEYQDGFTHVILTDQLSMPSPADPVAAKIQVANQLKALGTVRTQASIRLRSRSRFDLGLEPWAWAKGAASSHDPQGVTAS